MLNNSNLLTKSEAVEIDTSIPKISVIAFLGIAAATGFGYFINIFLKETTLNSFILAVTATLLFIVFFFLQSLYIKAIKINLFIVLGETIGLSLFFILNNYSLIVFIAAILTCLTLYMSLQKSRKELRNQLKINVIKIAKVSVPKIITALSILIALIYSQPFYPENLNIPRDLIKKIIYPSEALIKIANNNFNLGLNNFSVNMTLTQLAEENKLPLSILQKQIKDWGVLINDNETILDAIHSYINSKITGLNQTIKWAIFGGLLLVAFLTVKSIFWLFYWLIYTFIYLFYEILTAFGFSKIGYKQTNKEIIIL